MTIPGSNSAFAERIRARDPEALKSVADAYLPQVIRVARGAGLDADRAEDVAQATFVTFLEKADTFEGRSHVRTWLFGILYRKIAEARREIQRDKEHDDIDEIVESRFNFLGIRAGTPKSIETDIHRQDVAKQLEDCFEKLPARQRAAFLLREVQGFTTLEVCKILEVTRTNLGILLFRGRNRLRECLEAKGVRGSSDARL